MQRCVVHTEFKGGRCVECRRRHQRNYMRECRAARRLLKAIQAQQPISLSAV